MYDALQKEEMIGPLLLSRVSGTPYLTEKSGRKRRVTHTQVAKTPPVRGVHENNFENTLYTNLLANLPCATFARSTGCPHLGQRMKCHKVPANPKPADLAGI